MSGSTDDDKLQLDPLLSVHSAAREHHLGAVQLILEAFSNSIPAEKGVSFKFGSGGGTFAVGAPRVPAESAIS